MLSWTINILRESRSNSLWCLKDCSFILEPLKFTSSFLIQLTTAWTSFLRAAANFNLSELWSLLFRKIVVLWPSAHTISFISLYNISVDFCTLTNLILLEVIRYAYRVFRMYDTFPTSRGDVYYTRYFSPSNI